MLKSEELPQVGPRRYFTKLCLLLPTAFTAKTLAILRVRAHTSLLLVCYYAVHVLSTDQISRARRMSWLRAPFSRLLRRRLRQILHQVLRQHKPNQSQDKTQANPPKRERGLRAFSQPLTKKLWAVMFRQRYSSVYSMRLVRPEQNGDFNWGCRRLLFHKLNTMPSVTVSVSCTSV